MQKNIIFLLITICISSGLFISCSDVVFEEHFTFDNLQWKQDKVVRFDIPNHITITNHELSIEVEHTENYQYENIYIQTIREFTSTKDTLISSISLISPEGKWINSPKINIDPYDDGEHRIQSLLLSQYSRENVLEHVKKVSLIIAKK